MHCYVGYYSGKNKVVKLCGGVISYVEGPVVGLFLCSLPIFTLAVQSERGNMKIMMNFRENTNCISMCLKITFVEG